MKGIQLLMIMMQIGVQVRGSSNKSGKLLYNLILTLHLFGVIASRLHPLSWDFNPLLLAQPLCQTPPPPTFQGLALRPTPNPTQVLRCIWIGQPLMKLSFYHLKWILKNPERSIFSFPAGSTEHSSELKNKTQKSEHLHLRRQQNECKWMLFKHFCGLHNTMGDMPYKIKFHANEFTIWRFMNTEKSWNFNALNLEDRISWGKIPRYRFSKHRIKSVLFFPKRHQKVVEMVMMVMVVVVCVCTSIWYLLVFLLHILKTVNTLGQEPFCYLICITILNVFI